MLTNRWYVLYRDGIGHNIRAADGFDAAIDAAGRLHRDGRDVVQIGPLDEKRASEAIGTSEIRRLFVD